MKGQDNIRAVSMGTFTSELCFSKSCGIYMRHQRRSNPNEISIDVAALEGINPRDPGELEWYDGINQPSDR
ncbi:MAG: hypothetical protein ACU0DI_14275 [Paracoccaceae bacterium]